MIRTLIFDLSEVLIAGLVGVEGPLARRLGISESEVLAAFAGPRLEALCCGRLSENEYLAHILEEQGWPISAEEIRQVVQDNLRRRVPGMEALLARLAPRYELVLLSDHAAEWVAYIRGCHPFLELFSAQFFSFELGTTKHDPETFRAVLQAIGRAPGECLLIDDSEVNGQVARSVGLASIAFTGVYALVQALSAYGITAAAPISR